MFFTLCNPTEKPFVMHRLRASGYLLGADFFVATIDQPLHIPPRSVAELVVDLELQLGLVLPALGVAAGSWLSHRTSTFEQEVLEIHADIDTEISVRDSQAAFQMRINAPMLVRELPELTTLFWGETYEVGARGFQQFSVSFLGLSMVFMASTGIFGRFSRLQRPRWPGRTPRSCSTSSTGPCWGASSQGGSSRSEVSGWVGR